MDNSYFLDLRQHSEIDQIILSIIQELLNKSEFELIFKYVMNNIKRDYVFDINNMDFSDTDKNKLIQTYIWTRYNYNAYKTLLENGFATNRPRIQDLFQFFKINILKIISSQKYYEFYTSEKEYRLNKNAEGNHKIIDPLLVTLIKDLNTFPEIRTGWSCQGAAWVKQKEIPGIEVVHFPGNYTFDPFIFFPSNHGILTNIGFFKFLGLLLDKFIMYLNISFGTYNLHFLNGGIPKHGEKGEISSIKQSNAPIGNRLAHFLNISVNPLYRDEFIREFSNYLHNWLKTIYNIH